MLRSLYDRLVTLAAGPNAIVWLGLTAFVEASVFPIPPDILLIPMVLAAPRRAWTLALVCTLCSAAGGILGWFIGDALFARVALPIARAYHAEPALLHFADLFRRNGLWVILIKGLTPIPYKIVSIAAGAAHFSLPVFILASLATRGLRFFLEAALLRRFGEPVRHFVERRLTLATSVVAAAAIAGVLALKFL